MEEREAITLLKQGDLTGMEVLVLRHQVEAVQTAYLIVGDQSMAEDIAQAAFIKVAERIHQFKDGRPFRPWFLRIVTNDAIKAAAKAKRYLSLDSTMDSDASLAWLWDPHPGPEDIAGIAEERRRVWKALEKLTPKDRAVIIRRYYLDMSGLEISQELRRSISSVKWSLHSARQHLRSIFSSEKNSSPLANGDSSESEEGEGR
jgi:RNA polymerase sigma-70 factor (ECF subfamily)